ncbi:MAG TPA: MHFG family PEP-CTERM protein [Burkholderiaceae bacterium]
MNLLRICLIAAALMCGLLDPVFAMPASAGPTTVTQPSCAWERPGHNPFMSDVVAAVDDYRDIPPEVRARLKRRMARHDYDDIVRIRRDSITGRATYDATIRDMHFGTHQMCSSVTRAAWSARMQERGLVYCEGRQCILVPTVCRNVSRITRAAVEAEHVEAPDDPADKGAVAPAEVASTHPAAEPPSKPLAADGSPSFAAPLDPGGSVALGAPPGGPYWGAGDAGPRYGPSSGSVPTITTASVPPLRPDSPLPVTTPPVPEPQTWASMLGGLATLAAWRRRRINRRAAAPGSAR